MQGFTDWGSDSVKLKTQEAAFVTSFETTKGRRAAQEVFVFLYRKNKEGFSIKIGVYLRIDTIE